MAQLRDRQTSEILAEGTPLQVATLASKLGFDEVIFDDVGERFDPQAVLDNHAEMKANVPKDADAEFVAGVAALDKLPRGAVKSAQSVLDAARARIEG